MNYKAERTIIYWLLTGCLLIFLMVIIGGITRLTGSGLSITEWKVVTGTFPPLNETQWQQEFYQYKQSPQYTLINSHFTLENFKGIYWWEYLHRLLGRLTGMIFLIPFVYFLIKGWIDNRLLLKLIIIFCLGGLQGLVGWLMVATGLQTAPHVSHLALASHLIVAFTTFAFTFWVALDLIFGNEDWKLEIGNFGNSIEETLNAKPKTRKPKQLTFILLAFVFVQLIYGAFVAGLKAGHVYNTWPKMGDEWIAESVTFAFAKDGISSLVYNLATVQFIHRTIAIILFLMMCFMWIKRKNAAWSLSPQQCNALNIGVAIVMMQFLLGVFTLLYNVPIWLGVLHQAGAFVLLGAVVYQLHRLQNSD